MLCSDVMKNDVECLKPTDTVQMAARRMREKNIGFIPICDDTRKVVGTVTDRDLTLRILADAKAANTALQQVMSTDVVACRPNDELNRAQDLMEKRQKSRIVCTDGTGRPVGVISLSDIVNKIDDAAAVQTMRRVSSREVRV
jgi:CBS domain-containing protein